MRCCDFLLLARWIEECRKLGLGYSHDSEDDVGLVADTVERDGGNHDNHEVENPVSTGMELAY